MIKTSIYIVLALFGCVFANAQTHSPQMFSLSLTTDKFNYVLGEPVVLTVVIAYDGDSTLEVNSSLDNGNFKQIVEIAPAETGKFRRFATWEEARDALIDRTALPKIQWKSGTRVTNSYSMFYWRLTNDETNLIVFPSPGGYKIRFTIKNGNEEYSQEVQVSFSSPKSDADIKGWNWIQKQNPRVLEEYSEINRFLGVPQVRGRVMGDLDGLLTQNPESVHAKYITQILAKHSLAQKPSMN